MLLLACATLSLLAAPAHPREVWARRLEELQRETLTRASVRKALGKPDAIYTPANPDPFGYLPCRETWVYGLDGPGTAPTIATIPFDKGRPMQYWWREGFHWPQVPEAKIRAGMRVWQKWWPSNFRGDIYADASEPLALRKIAYELLPHGKDAILASLEEICLLDNSATDRLMAAHIAVLRLLFELDEQGARSDWSEEIENGKRWLDMGTIAEGIPIPFPQFGGRTGPPITAERVVALFAKYGKLRASLPLPPLDPFEWASRASESPDRKKGNWQNEPKNILRDLMVSLMPRSFDESIMNGDLEAVQATLTQRWKGKKLLWDPKRQIYVDSNGGFKRDCRLRLPVVRSWSSKEVCGGDLYLVFRRVSSDLVMVTYYAPLAEKAPKATVHVEVVSGRVRPALTVTEWNTEGDGRTGWAPGGDMALLNAGLGSKIRVRYKTRKGPGVAEFTLDYPTEK